MAWLDPPECVAADDCLQQGNAAEAARLLLACKYPQHRAVRKRLLEAGRRLAETAEEQLQAGHLEAAEAAIRLAARCMVLEGTALGLQRQITEMVQQKQQCQAWLGKQLDLAQEFAETGRLHSALDVLAPVGEHARGVELRTAI